MNREARPPRAAEWLLERVLPDSVLGESIVGDLREAYASAVVRVGRPRARLEYWVDVIRVMGSRPGHPSRGGSVSEAALDERAVRAHSGVVLGTADDARQTTRSLFRAPAFSAVTVLTLAVGIGATAAVFSVVDGVLLRPLPYDRPETLISVMHAAPGIGASELALSTGTFFTYLDEAQTLEGIGAWGYDYVSVTGGGDPEELEVVALTHGTLSLLGVRAALGRLFNEEDDTPVAPRVVILSDEYWRIRLGADADAVGSTLTIEGAPFEVVGVLPHGFRFMGDVPAMYFPIRFDRARAFVGTYNYPAVARVRDGVTRAEVRAELQALIPIAAETYAGATVERVREMQLMPVIRPLKEAVIGDVGGMLWLLLGATGFVLLVGCANVANLFLVRAEARHREWSIRTALGAARARMARLFLLESAALALGGGVLGLGLATAGVHSVRVFGPANVPRLDEIAVDANVVGFSVIVAVVITLILGMVPFLRYGRIGRTGTLIELGRGQSASPHRHRARSGLAVTQIALALTLLIGAGLMIRSLRAMSDLDPGFDASTRILTFRIFVPSREAVEPPLVVRMHRDILESVAAIPGVESAGLSTSVPMDGRTFGNTTSVEEHQAETAQARRYKFVSEGFFETMSTPMLAGRAFTWADVEERHDVAIVSESFAREYWPDVRTAIGKRISQSNPPNWREIVGVVADIRDDGLTREPPPIVYWPIAVRDFWGDEDYVNRTLVYAVRVRGTDASGIAEAVRQAVWSVNDRLPVADIRTQRSIVDARTARSSFVMVLLGIASAIALMLGVVGLYGVISYLVSTRSREIGIRLAIGAVPARVVSMVLRQGAILALVGVASGVLLAAALTRLMSSLLYGVEPTDPITYALAAAFVAVVALLATAAPALGAASIDPVRALDAE